MTAAGAVLCGGRSTRMGRDKATLPVDGTPMAVRVAGALAAAGCAPVIAVGGDVAALTALGLEVVADRHPGEGPLGGIVTALDALAGRGAAGPVVVAGCDLPWLDAATVRAIIDALDGHAAAVANSGRDEPLCAAWDLSCRDRLGAMFAAGVRAVHRALNELDVIAVAVDPRAVRNVNAPADVSRETPAADG